MLSGQLNFNQVYQNDSYCHTVSQKIRRILHWGPSSGLSIVLFLTSVSVYTINATVRPFSSLLGFANMAFILLEFYSIMRGYLSAAWFGPGFVIKQWEPANSKNQSKLQYCSVCKGHKPPRAHHCSSCERCVLKMDHHCPWINSCVGHLNHGMFMHFVISAPIGCLHCSVLCVWHLYYVFTRAYFLFIRGYNFRLIYSFYECLVVLIALGLAVGVILAVGGLAFCQIRAIMRNETAIESWICAKADDRSKIEGEAPFVYPYHLGRTTNLLQVLSFKGYPIGDGYSWPLKPGCREFDLTIEQLKQKAMKSKIAREIIVRRVYSGGLFPLLSFGPKVACCFPCSGEHRLPVKPGDHVLVTRRHRLWLYGQRIVKVTDHTNGDVSNARSSRGWFPRACADDIKTASSDKKLKSG